MGSKKGYTPNDMRSRMMNPQDSWCKDAMDNRSNQMNPNHSESKDSDE